MKFLHLLHMMLIMPDEILDIALHDKGLILSGIFSGVFGFWYALQGLEHLAAGLDGLLQKLGLREVSPPLCRFEVEAIEVHMP